MEIILNSAMRVICLIHTQMNALITMNKFTITHSSPKSRFHGPKANPDDKLDAKTVDLLIDATEYLKNKK